MGEITYSSCYWECYSVLANVAALRFYILCPMLNVAIAQDFKGRKCQLCFVKYYKYPIYCFINTHLLLECI